MSAVAYFQARHGADGFGAAARVGTIASGLLVLLSSIGVVILHSTGTPTALLTGLFFGGAYLALSFGVSVSAGVLVHRGRIAALWRARLSGVAGACVAAITLLGHGVRRPLFYVVPPLLDLALVCAVGFAAVRRQGLPRPSAQSSPVHAPSLRAAVWRYGRDSALRLPSGIGAKSTA